MSQKKQRICRLAPLEFPINTGIRRDNPWKKPHREPGARINNYDSRTFAYDAFYSLTERKIILVCPKLLNFKRVLQNGTYTTDVGRCQVSSIIDRNKYSEVRLDIIGNESAMPNSLSFQYDAINLDCELNTQDISTFHNMRCLIAISKNNHLQWIRDWARHHVERHGTNAVLLIDNESDDYSLRELDNALSSVQGLECHRILHCPFSYGPYSCQHARFLQVSMLNLARLRFFQKAAGILSVDVDELVVGKGDITAYELANRSLLGFCTFRGQWVYPPEHISRQPFHSDHYYENAGEVTGRPYERASLKKFCVNPQKQVGMSPWRVHGSPFKLNTLVYTRKIRYLHCWGITTNWHNNRNTMPDNLRPHRELFYMLQHLRG